MAALREQVATALTTEREEVISELLEKILAHKIALEDVFPAAKIAPATVPAADASSARKKGVPKYRDPVTGATWTGRGKPPGWIAGKDKYLFLIVAPNAASATGDVHKPAEGPPWR